MGTSWELCGNFVGISWELEESHGNLWELHGSIGTSGNFAGFPWEPGGSHGKHVETYGNLWEL